MFSDLMIFEVEAEEAKIRYISPEMGVKAFVPLYKIKHNNSTKVFHDRKVKIKIN